MTRGRSAQCDIDRIALVIFFCKLPFVVSSLGLFYLVCVLLNSMMWQDSFSFLHSR